MHYSEQLNNAKSNIKLTWGIINKILWKKRQHLLKESSIMNETIIDNNDKANNFNPFFLC